MSEHTYVWEAVYMDGSRHPQYNVDGQELMFRDIDQGRLKEFNFSNPKTKHTITLTLTENMRLICFRRVRMPMNGGLKTTTYILGFQETINGTNFKSMVEINAQGDMRFIRE